MKRGKGLKTTKPLKSKSRLLSAKPIKKVGKKTKEWAEVRRDVIDWLFANRVQPMCEARLDGCTGDLYLTLAHSKRRRFIRNREELEEVAILCSNCHSTVDSWKKENTEHYIKQLIEKRNKQ